MTRRVPVIVVACALLLTAAFWFLLYQPRRVEQARYVDETAQLESQRTQLDAQIAALRDVEANAADHRSRLVRLTEFIPDDPAQPPALRDLQGAADSSGVEITQMVFGDPEAVVGAPETGDTATTLARIPVQMTVEGGYFQAVDLLRRIEVDLARAIKVDTVSIAEAEDEFPRLSVTWSGHIFAVLPAVDVTSPDGQPVVPAQPSGATEAPADGTTPTDQQTSAPDAATDAPADSGAAPDGTTETGTS
ncbi:MAG TPA: type 4a pilus biogenesis protein PilO [Euzebyales bacterium]|nr:type 4a pilus biogenesis protein PilO [Euzebyales bacterium]